MILEPFVSPEVAAEFLSIPRKTLLKLARSRQLPGHSLGRGPRKQWRFKKSELDAAIKAGSNSASHPRPQIEGTTT